MKSRSSEPPNRYYYNNDNDNDATTTARQTQTQTNRTNTNEMHRSSLYSNRHHGNHNINGNGDDNNNTNNVGRPSSRRRRPRAAATSSSANTNSNTGVGDYDLFGEFPPQLSAATPEISITTPQTSNKQPPPQSTVRFAEDTRGRGISPSMIRRPSNNNQNHPTNNQNQVLVLGGRSTDRRRQQEQSASSSNNMNMTPSASTSESRSLDFSMIATPGGKLARMVDNDGEVYTPSEAYTTPGQSSIASASSGRWTTGTPFSRILRGVVSSTPGMNINPRQILTSNTNTPYTSARESLQQPTSPGVNFDDSSNNANTNTNNECTGLMFARSAPLSGYLRKLGKNIPTFKRRFFVLKPSTHLYYFMSPNDVEPRGCIDLDTIRNNNDNDGDNTGCCEVREIGLLPDGTFRFELLFDEDTGEEDDNSTIAEDDTDNASDAGSSRTSQGSLSKQRSRNFRRKSIVLEARTEEIGREWMAKLQSERLSTARNEVDYLRTNLTEMTSISSRWEDSACEEAARADGAERQRNTAISEAKSWEEKFTNLNEAIRLLLKNEKTQGTSSSSSEFLEEAIAGLDLNGTNFSDITDLFQEMQNDYNRISKREGEANKRIEELEERSRKAEARADDAESELAKVWEDNRFMQNDIKKTRREKKVLVKEVRSLRAEVEENALKQQQQQQSTQLQRYNCNNVSSEKQQQQHDLRSVNSQSEHSRGGTSDALSSFTRPKRKLNAEEKRLVIELEEHVMSGLKLSEQFLTLNGIDPFEVGDDLDNSVHQASVQASRASADKSPERPKYHSSQKALLDISTPYKDEATDSETLQQDPGKPLGSLFDDDENEDASEVALVSESTQADEADKEIDHDSDVDDVNVSFTVESTHGSEFFNDIVYQVGATPSGEPVNQNLNDRFSKQLTVDTQIQTESTSNNNNNQQPLHNMEGNSADRVPSFDAASSISGSTRSRVTDNGNATTKLECPLKDVGETPHPQRSKSTLGDDGKVYHITFYSAKIGLQFQKVPNETKSSGLLTAAMTADHGANVEANQTAAELRRIASISQHNSNNRIGGGVQAKECLPVTPQDAVLVCGYVGFDDSTGNSRPRIGARLVAFDGIPVEVGQWTFESIRKSIQARGRPLTLSFRNDFLTPKQREILTKAIEEVKPPPQPVAHSHHVHRGNVPAIHRRNQDYHHHQNTIYTSTSSITSQRSQQQPKNKYYSLSEAGSSISSAVAPLMSNLLSNSKSSSGKQHDDFAPDYLRRTSDSLDKMRHHHDFQSGLL